MASSFDDPLQSTSALPAPQPMRAKPPEPSHLGLSVTPTTAYPTPRTSSRDSKRVSDAMVDQICQACSQGDIETLDDLLEEDAELTAFTLVNSSKKSGLTPLHFAASRGRTAVVEHLFEQGALIMEDSSGETPVHLAALKGHLSTLKALIEVGGQDAAEAQDSDGWTALHNACSKGFLDCVRYLVEDVGVQVDALSKARYTPLMNASGKGSRKSLATQNLLH
jgi:ankyrin repeat protein